MDLQLKALLKQREDLKARNNEIVKALATLPKSSPERTRLVGEQMTNNLLLKQLKPLIAQGQLRANGAGSVVSSDVGLMSAGDQIAEQMGGRIGLESNAVHSYMALQALASQTDKPLTTKQIAAMVAMHALVLKFADKENSPGKVEDRANDIAEAAWQIADAMFDLPTMSDEPEDPEG